MDRRGWRLAHQGHEGRIFARGHRARKLLPISIEPCDDVASNLARVRMLARVNLRAAELGVGPRNVTVTYARPAGEPACVCIEYDLHPGNVIVDGADVTVVDFGYDCLDLTAHALLAERMLSKLCQE